MAKNTTTRWDALSMRDRASLIKLYSQAGVRKLDDIKAHYNKFETGGDKDNNLYFNPDYSSNNPQYKVDPTVEPLHVEQPYTPDDFFDRWYPNRTRQIQNNLNAMNRYKGVLFPNKAAGRDTKPFINSMLRNAKLVKEYTLLHPGNYDREETFMFPNALKDSVARESLNNSVRTKNRILGKEIMNDYPDGDLRWEAFGSYGFSKPAYPHQIFYTTAKPSENTIVHERTHPLRPELGSDLSKKYMVYPLFMGGAFNPMEWKIILMNKQLKASERGEKLSPKDAEYYFSAEELNARMNAIREQQNINPKHTITKEDLQEIKKNAHYKDREGFLDLLDDDSLLRLFNDVASTNEKIDISNVAANGGSIHINPKNRGKFNALLKRTGKSASWFKEHGTPLQRKRATFALNARKWKHPDGGDINVLGNPSYNKAQEEYMYRYLKDSGMDDTHVAAIMGNIAVESLLNADQNQDRGPAWGLIQAEGNRQEAMRSYNDVPYLFGSRLSPEEQRQLDYIIEKGIKTYTPGEWGKDGFSGARQARKGFINETDLTKATDIFMRNYERPSKQHRSWRQNMSKYYYDKYKEPEYYVPLDFFNK